MCGKGRLPSSSSGRAAREDALERTSERSCWNFASRSFTMMIPSEEGPNASVRASKETVPVNGQHLVRCPL